MKRIIATAAAASLALALGAVEPTPAAANPVAAGWIAVAIFGGLAAGAVVGATVVHANQVAAAPAPMPGVYVTNPGCHFTHARIHGVWRRVEVCR